MFLLCLQAVFFSCPSHSSQLILSSFLSHLSATLLHCNCSTDKVNSYIAHYGKGVWLCALRSLCCMCLYASNTIKAITTSESSQQRSFTWKKWKEIMKRHKWLVLTCCCAWLCFVMIAELKAKTSIRTCAFVLCGPVSPSALHVDVSVHCYCFIFAIWIILALLRHFGTTAWHREMDIKDISQNILILSFKTRTGMSSGPAALCGLILESQTHSLFIRKKGLLCWCVITCIKAAREVIEAV